MVEHIAKHLYRRNNTPNSNYYCCYRDNRTKKWKSFSCRTNNKEQASAYALAKLMAMHNANESALSRLTTGGTRSRGSASHQLPLECTISEFANEYIESIRTKRKRRPYSDKSKRALRDSFNQLQKRFGDVRIADLTPSQCRAFILSGQPSERTAEKHYVNLRAAFRTAMEWLLRLDNPFDYFEPPVPEDDREKWEEITFTDELLTHLLQFIPEDTFVKRRLRRMVIFAYETGMRLAEIRNAQRNWVNTETGLIIVRSNADFRTKSGESRIIPLSELALSVYEEQLRENRSHAKAVVRESGYIFPTVKGGAVSESRLEHEFTEARNAAFVDNPPEGFPLIRGKGRSLPIFHGLRHAFVSRLAAQGASDRQIMPVTGHKAPSTVSRYTHIKRRVTEPIREALNRSSPNQVVIGRTKR